MAKLTDLIIMNNNTDTIQIFTTLATVTK